MCASLSVQAFGALGRGCWHYIDQTERSQSIPSVPTSTAVADLCLCLLRVPGERHNMYVQEDNGCGFVCLTLFSGCCTQTTQCSSLAWSYLTRMIHSVWCMKYQSTMPHFHAIIVVTVYRQCFDRETLAPAGTQSCLALWMLKFQKQQITR